MAEISLKIYPIFLSEYRVPCNAMYYITLNISQEGERTERKREGTKGKGEGRR
jgi:hypothetical protein